MVTPMTGTRPMTLITRQTTTTATPWHGLTTPESRQELRWGWLWRILTILILTERGPTRISISMILIYKDMAAGTKHPSPRPLRLPLTVLAVVMWESGWDSAPTPTTAAVMEMLSIQWVHYYIFIVVNGEGGRVEAQRWTFSAGAGWDAGGGCRGLGSSFTLNALHGWLTHCCPFELIQLVAHEVFDLIGGRRHFRIKNTIGRKTYRLLFLGKLSLTRGSVETREVNMPPLWPIPKLCHWSLYSEVCRTRRFSQEESRNCNMWVRINNYLLLFTLFMAVWRICL